MRPGSAWARVPTPRAPRGQGDRSPEDAGPTEQVSLPGGVGTRPACPGAPPGRSTHAWMRLARSFCEGLVPGVPKGLWPPEIMPDMLQREPLTRRRFSPPPLIPTWPFPSAGNGHLLGPEPALSPRFSLTAACQFHQLSQQHPFLA